MNSKQLLDLDTNKMLNDSGYTSTDSIDSMSLSSRVYKNISQDSQLLESSPQVYLNSENQFVSQEIDNSTNYHIPLPQSSLSEKQIYLVIIEQPTNQFRFRYLSEMDDTHGSLRGFNSSKINKLFPTVELKGFNGNALVRCSLYQIDKKTPHSHCLIFKNGNKEIKEPHDVKLNMKDGYRAVYADLSIIYTAKRNSAKILYERQKLVLECEKGIQLNTEENKQLIEYCTLQAKKINLNQVVLRFEAYEIIDNKLKQLCEPIYSNIISNSKSASTGELKITRLSSCVSSAEGGDDLFLFVEKVDKKKIKVKFFELEDDKIVWFDYGLFTEADVHHQYAIALRTPPYKNIDIDKYVSVFVQLERSSNNLSDDENHLSEPLAFKYKPRDIILNRKRARYCSTDSFIDKHIKNNEIGVLDEANCKDTDFDLNMDLDKNFPEELMDIRLENLNNTDINDTFLMNGASINFDRIACDCPQILHNETFNTEQMMAKLLNILKNKSDDLNPNRVKHDIKNFLIECNEKNENLLYRIIRKQEVSYGILLLKLLAKLNLNEICNLPNTERNNSLHIACIYNRSMFIKSLISMGNNINQQNYKGHTPLHISVEKEFEECIIKILDKKNYIHEDKILNIDLENDNGDTPLHIAIRKRNLNIVKILVVDGKASIDICCSKNGKNALFLAIEENCPDIVKFLLNNSTIKINRKSDKNEYTALSLAQSMGEKGNKIVKILLEHMDKMNEFVEEELLRSLKIGENISLKYNA